MDENETLVSSLERTDCAQPIGRFRVDGKKAGLEAASNRIENERRLSLTLEETIGDEKGKGLWGQTTYVERSQYPLTYTFDFPGVR